MVQQCTRGGAACRATGGQLFGGGERRGRRACEPRRGERASGENRSIVLIGNVFVTRACAGAPCVRSDVARFSPWRDGYACCHPAARAPPHAARTTNIAQSTQHRAGACDLALLLRGMNYRLRVRAAASAQNIMFRGGGKQKLAPHKFGKKGLMRQNLTHSSSVSSDGSASPRGLHSVAMTDRCAPCGSACWWSVPHAVQACCMPWQRRYRRLSRQERRAGRRARRRKGWGPTSARRVQRWRCALGLACATRAEDGVPRNGMASAGAGRAPVPAPARGGGTEVIVSVAHAVGGCAESPHHQRSTQHQVAELAEPASPLWPSHCLPISPLVLAGNSSAWEAVEQPQVSSKNAYSAVGASVAAIGSICVAGRRVRTEAQAGSGKVGGVRVNKRRILHHRATRDDGEERGGGRYEALK